MTENNRILTTPVTTVILEKYDYRDLWQSLVYLENHGHWEVKNDKMPPWVMELAELFNTHTGSASVLLTLWREIAIRAVEHAEGLENPDVPGEGS